MIMGFNKPPGVPCPPNNPHCHGDVPDVLIDNWIFMSIITILILIYIFYIMKPKVFITREQADKLNAIALELGITVTETEVKSLFEKFYDSISIFLFGYKSFKWGELKGF